VLEGGVDIGRIFLSPVAPQERPWIRASGHNGDIRRAEHGYEPTREAAMAAFREELAEGVSWSTSLIPRQARLSREAGQPHYAKPVTRSEPLHDDLGPLPAKAGCTARRQIQPCPLHLEKISPLGLRDAWALSYAPDLGSPTVALLDIELSRLKATLDMHGGNSPKWTQSIGPAVRMNADFAMRLDRSESLGWVGYLSRQQCESRLVIADVLPQPTVLVHYVGAQTVSKDAMR
jgi:hypothetical protein